MVSRCRSLVDRQEYAVKRIPFRCRTAAAAERTLREVTVLASLDHPNIVKYNTAWLEAGGPRPTGSRAGGDSAGLTELVEGETASGVSGGSLGSVSALSEGHSKLLATDSSTGFVVTWDRDPAETGTGAEAGANTEDGAQMREEESKEEESFALSSQDSSSAVVFRGTAKRPGQTVESSTSGLSQAESKSSAEPTTSWDNTSAATRSLDSSAPRAEGAAAVLPSGVFGYWPPGGVGGAGCCGAGAGGGGGTAGRFWSSAGSSSGSTSASSAARHTPVTRSQSAAATSSKAVAERSMSRYRRTVSAPAAGWLTLYIQMQPCERTLKDWLQDRNHAPAPGPSAGGEKDRLIRVDAHGCHRLLRDVLLGLHFIHQRGIIHRDLKPANIFLAFSGRAMIGDFGLARARAPATTGASSGGSGGEGGSGDGRGGLESHLPGEQTGGVGTATYASPEQAAGGDYDQSTDLYSLGVVMYELFAPFGTAMERSGELRRLRQERHCAADVAARWPAVAEAVLALTAEERSQRPCAAHLLTSPLFSSAADRLLQLEATAAHQSRLLEARAARGRQLAQQLDSCRHEAAVTERLLRNSCSQLRRQLAERDRELERLRALLELHGIKPP